MAQKIHDEASSVQLIENPARKSITQTHKKRKVGDAFNRIDENEKKSVNKSDQDPEQYFLLMKI